MNKQERQNRIIAKGEFSDHCHVITGDAEVIRKNGQVLIKIGNEGAVLKHILESAYLEGNEVWTKEHTDIDLYEKPKQVRHGDVMLELIDESTYLYIQQMAFDPLDQRIKQVQD